MALIFLNLFSNSRIAATCKFGHNFNIPQPHSSIDIGQSIIVIYVLLSKKGK